jgi:phosphohistidine phosphatase
MELILLRHAEAAEAVLGQNDADRPLTENGYDQVRALVRAWRTLGLGTPRIATSPLLRARQTAETLRDGLGLPDDSLTEIAGLAPGLRPRRLARRLRRERVPFLVVVGHQPDLGLLAGWLIGGRRTRVELAKAGLAWIVCDEGPAKRAGELHLLLTPEWYGPVTPPAAPEAGGDGSAI